MEHMPHMHQTAAYPVLFPPVPPPLGMPSPAFMGAPNPSPVGFSYWPYLMANHILPPGYGPPSAAALWADYSGVATTPCEALGAGVPPVPPPGHHTAAGGGSAAGLRVAAGGPPLLPSGHLELAFRRHHTVSPPPGDPRRGPACLAKEVPNFDEPLTMEELYLDRRGGGAPESYTRLLEQFAMSEIAMRCDELEPISSSETEHRRFRCTLCPPEKGARFSDLFALKLHREKAHEDFLGYELVDSLAESLLAEAATPPGPPSGAKRGPPEEAMETEDASAEGGEACEAKEKEEGYFPPPPPPLLSSATTLRRQTAPPPPPPPQLMLSGNLTLSQCGPGPLPGPLAHLHGPECNLGRCNGFASDARRGRTRLSEQQRRILRASFSLSQSPSEEDIGDLAQRTQLPGRVVKHWFRNTLFKERQRCRDSPYNFGVPPRHGAEEDATSGAPARSDVAPGGGGGDEEKLTNGPGESSSASRSHSVSSVESCMDSIEMDSNPDGDLCWQQPNAMAGPMAAAAACDGGQLPANYPYFYRQYLTYILSHIQQQQQQQQQHQQQEQHRHHQHHHHEQHRHQLQENLQLQQLLHFHSGPTQPTPTLAPPPPPPSTSCAGPAGVDVTPCSISAASSAGSLPSNSTSLSSGAEDSAPAAGNTAGGGSHPTANGTAASPSPQPPTSGAPGDEGSGAKAHGGPLFVPAVSTAPPPEITTTPAGAANGDPGPGATAPGSASGAPQGLQQYHRRVRTTINNNQLSYLLSCYEKDSNPSKRQQEAIASRTGLPRRVVQVWFQNTRARDRKGTLRGIGASAGSANCASGGGQLTPQPPPPPPSGVPMAQTGGGPAAKIRRQETPTVAVGAKQCPRCTATFRSTTAFELHTIRCRPPALSQAAAPPLQLSSPGAAVKAPTAPVARAPPLAPPRAHERVEERPLTPTGAPAPPPPPPPLLPPRQLAPPPAPALPVMPSLHLPLSGAFAPPPVDLSRGEASAPTDAASSGAPSTPAGEGSSAEGGLDLSNDQPLDLSTWQKPREVSPPCLVLAPHSAASLSAPPPSQPPAGIDSEAGAAAAAANALTASGGANGRPTVFASGGGSGANKRSRTNITPFQLRMMREIFPLHKMPTVAECETLGKRIGLSRRVVQVWFQNQRAKEKKNAREGQAPGSGGSSCSNDSPVLDSPQGTGAGQQQQQQQQQQSPRATGPCLSREMCSLCNTRFDSPPGGATGTANAGPPGNEESSLGAHLFSTEHLTNLGAFLEKCGIQQHRDSAPGKCLLSLQRPPEASTYMALGSGCGGSGLVSPPPWLPHSSPDK